MRSVYKIVRTEKELDKLIQYVLETGYCSFDFETTSLKYYEESEYPTILGVSFQVGSGWIIPLGHFDSPFKDNYVAILKKFAKATICNPNIIKTGWNLKYEYKWLRRYNIEPVGRVFDAMLAKYPLDEERPHGLKENVALLLPEFAGYDLPGAGSAKFNWATVPLEKLSKYCGLDCDLSLRLFLFYESRLMDKGFYPLYRNMFCMLVRALGKMEFEGIPIDLPYLDRTIKKYKDLINENEQALRDNPNVRRYQKYRNTQRKTNYLNSLQERIEDSSDNPRILENLKNRVRMVTLGNYSNKEERGLEEPINFGSPPQMADLLYNSPKGFKYECIEYTDTGNPSTSEETLLKLKEETESPFIDALLKYRELQKLDSTYISGMRERVSSHIKVHCSYKINGTVTGRLSSTDPNMQNVPRMCISRDQLIITKGGPRQIGDFIPDTFGVRPIKGLKVKTHTGKWQRVLYGVNKGEEEMFEVELENGEKITCTMGHKLLTPGGWESLKDIVLNNLTVMCHEH